MGYSSFSGKWTNSAANPMIPTKSGAASSGDRVDTQLTAWQINSSSHRFSGYTLRCQILSNTSRTSHSPIHSHESPNSLSLYVSLSLFLQFFALLEAPFPEHLRVKKRYRALGMSGNLRSYLKISHLQKLLLSRKQCLEQSPSAGGKRARHSETRWSPRRNTYEPRWNHWVVPAVKIRFETGFI